MLQIRQEQMDAMSAASLKRFLNQLVQHCRSAWASQIADWPDARVRRRLRGTISRAEQYGITAEVDVARFVDLTFVWGVGFESIGPAASWAGPILNDLTSAGPVKINQLRERTRVELAKRSGRMT